MPLQAECTGGTKKIKVHSQLEPYMICYNRKKAICFFFAISAFYILQPKLSTWTSVILRLVAFLKTMKCILEILYSSNFCVSWQTAHAEASSITSCFILKVSADRSLLAFNVEPLQWAPSGTVIRFSFQTKYITWTWLVVYFTSTQICWCIIKLCFIILLPCSVSFCAEQWLCPIVLCIKCWSFYWPCPLMNHVSGCLVWAPC